MDGFSASIFIWFKYIWGRRERDSTENTDVPYSIEEEPKGWHIQSVCSASWEDPVSRSTLSLNHPEIQDSVTSLVSKICCCEWYIRRGVALAIHTAVTNNDICSFQEFNCWFGVLDFWPGFSSISIGMKIGLIRGKVAFLIPGYKHAVNRAIQGDRKQVSLTFEEGFFISLCQPIIEPEIFLCL